MLLIGMEPLGGGWDWDWDTAEPERYQQRAQHPPSHAPLAALPVDSR